VYVVHWNAPDWVRATTDAFLASTVPVHVTVVDNGPPGALPSFGPEVRTVESGANLGYAGGANVGIADWLSGDAPFAVVACHDVVLPPDALERLLAAIEARPGYGVLAPEPGDGVAGGPVLAPGDAVGDVDEVGWASGTCLLLRRACVEQIGPFDADFGSYVEDVDFCRRARDAGWEVGVLRGVAAGGRGSVEPGFRSQMYVNQVRMRAKHDGAAAAARMTAAFPLLAVADASRWVTRRDPALLRRAGGRLRAVPKAIGLVWRRARA
jgi:hypothetical protein